MSGISWILKYKREKKEGIQGKKTALGKTEKYSQFGQQWEGSFGLEKQAHVMKQENNTKRLPRVSRVRALTLIS